MTIPSGDNSWHPSSNMNPAPVADHGTILLGTQTVEVSALAVAILNELTGVPLNEWQIQRMNTLTMYKPFIYQKVRYQHYLIGPSNTSLDTISLWVKHYDKVCYGASNQSNSSIPTTPPPMMGESTSPVTKRVILINQDKRKQNTSTKVVPVVSSPSLSASQQLSNDW